MSLAARVRSFVLRAIAERLATMHPLEPYPGWHFALDYDGPGWRKRLRRRIWRWSRERDVDLEVAVPWHHGTRFWTHLPNDVSTCVFVCGCFDPNELCVLDRVLTPGSTFVDGGSNEGLYALFASRCVGPTGVVLAVEPSRRELVRLNANLERNRVSNVRVRRAALGATSGTATLQVAVRNHEGLNSLGPVPAGCSDREEVPLVTLDELVASEGLARVDVIKLDIEGAELAALEGAERTIVASHPLLCIEVFDDALRAQGRSEAELVAWLAGHGYELMSFDDRGAPVRVTAIARPGNVLAVHRDRPWPAIEAGGS